EMSPGRLPLSPGLDPPLLAKMSDEEEHRADLWATGISATHPIQFIRSQLDQQGCVPVMTALQMHRNGVEVRVGGMVTHRQRPGTARGVIFFNLEDETGLLNVVVLPEVWAKNREEARRYPGIIIGGRLEYRDGVTNLVAHRFWPLSVAGLPSRDFR
ncbi:MAG TPA: OB-fold nucleic acid binding domain-containing protein, partial [Acidimicrobiia bacterium]|nr:OB-fold nucleic acid binding domain-containing protein [Acidimicrobiia bacterium]